MLEIENSLLTGAIQVDSDADGNVRILQNKQEIKLTPSQVLDIKEYLHCVLDKLAYIKLKGDNNA